MSFKTGFKNGRLGIGIPSGGGDGNGDPLYPLDINGDIRLTGAIVKADGTLKPIELHFTLKYDPNTGSVDIEKK